MNEKVKAFYEVVSEDEALSNELNQIVGTVELTGDEDVDQKAMAEAIAAFAAAHDLDLVAAGLDAAEAEGELSEAEFASVAGGKCGCFIIGASKGCRCFFSGNSKEQSVIGGKTDCPFVG